MAVTKAVAKKKSVKKVTKRVATKRVATKKKVVAKKKPVRTDWRKGRKIGSVYVSTPFWHVHHQQLWEMMDRPDNRLLNIQHKPKDERATRFERMRPMKLNTTQRAALLRLNKAEAVLARYDRRSKGYAPGEAQKLRDNRTNAYRDFVNTIEPTLHDMHAKQCKDCPWDGRTLFPNKPNAG